MATVFLPRSQPRAFTLPEVMVVLAIVAILAGFLTPALLKAIARGRVTQCTNNLYQLGFALQRYDERQGKIPGWLNASVNAPTTACSWPVPLLPFLGRTDLADMWPSLPNKPTIDGFTCPSNRPPKTVTYPVLHYAGNIGMTGTNANDGVFLELFTAGTKGVSLDDISDADGTTTTLAFTEKASPGFPPHTWIYTSSTVPKGSLFGSGTALPPVFGAATPPGPTFPLVSRTSTRHFAPASNHPDGAVAVFCDGHTVFLSGTLQSYEYAQLLTPRSRWQGITNKTNSVAMQPWLLKSGQPYVLDEKILKP